MRWPFTWTVTAALAVCALPLAACTAAGGGDLHASGASQSTARAVPESGRTLTQAELLKAGVPSSQWPNDLDLLLDSGSEWQAPQAATSPPPRAVPACQPLIGLFWGFTHPSATVVVGFERSGDAILGEADLASYPHGRASALFASIRQAVRTCPGFTASNQYGTSHERIVTLQGPQLGDESISFGTVAQRTGFESLNRYDYVRVGAATVLIKQIGDTVAAPPAVPSLLAPQVAKLKAAQS